MKTILLFLLIIPHLYADPPTKKWVSVLPEGTKVVDAQATLTRTGPSAPMMITIDLKQKGNTDSLIALPSQRLAEMEAAIEKEANTLFRITGDIFAYGDRNYILVRDAVLLEGHAERNHPTIIPIDPNAEQVHKEDFEDSVADIVRDLEDATGSLVRSIRNAADNPIQSRHLQEGRRYSMRRCHITRNESGAWIAVFVSDATGLSDPPCTILPSTEFGKLTKWASETNASTPVLIAGELTNYHGHGFLVLRSWRIVHNTDHLDN